MAAVACGYHHTLCLSLDKLMFVWGTGGKHGCLGLPKEKKDAVVEVKEPYCLSMEADLDAGLYSQPVRAIAAGQEFECVNRGQR